MSGARVDADFREGTVSPLGRWLDGSALALIAAIVMLTFVRTLVALNTGLTDDEAYYRLWALAPALSHLDHPPMVGWMIAAGQWAAGDSVLGLRFSALAISFVGPFVLWRSANLLFGEQAARRAVWIALAMPLLAVGGILMTPDTPSVLFWGLSNWAVVELYASRNPNWWLVVGVFAGLGLISKYTNLFVGASILIWLLLLPENRRWFRAWQLWAGGLIACLVTLPVVVWNARHDWVSFSKQFGRVTSGREFTLTYVAEMLGAFAGLASPPIAAIAAMGLCNAVRSAFRTRNSACALLAASAVPLLAYFFVHALHGRVQPNWLAPVYPSLAVCAAIALDRLESRSKNLIGRLGLGALLAGFLTSAFVYLHALTPLTLGIALRDPAGQMRGWQDLAGEVERLRSATGSCWIATSSYATTGQLHYVLKDTAPVIQINERQRYGHLPAPAFGTVSCPALYVDLERRVPGAVLGENFDSVSFLRTIIRRHGSLPIASYAVYAVSSPRPRFLSALTARGQ